MRNRRRWRRWASGAGLFLLGSCGHDATGPTVARVRVSPALDTIPFLGGSAQYLAEVEGEDGSPVTGAAVTWSVTDGSVASIDPISGLAIALSPGATTVRATAGPVTGEASLVVHQHPASMVPAAGDDQVGYPGERLSSPIQVEVRDEGGSPIAGVPVVFVVVEGGGSVDGSSPTDVTGRASATWILGAAGPQRLLARIGEELSAEFHATADPSAVVIVSDALVNAYVSVPYDRRLEARGGTGPYTWTVDGGALPDGLVLGDDGRLQGEPLGTGLFSFTVRAHPTAGADAVRALDLRACAAPPDISVGAALTLPLPTSDGCGLFLRSEEGARFRVGVLREDVEGDPDASNVVTATLTVTSHAPGAGLPTARRAPGRAPESATEVAPRDEIQALHARLRADETRLWARYEGKLRALESLRQPAKVAPARFQYDPPRDLSSCTDHEDRAALLVARNDRVAVYQDSIQRQSLPVTGSAVAALLDFYEAYGHAAIEDYTGGLPDINGDGLLVVLATPEGPGRHAALVWSGDLLDAQTCPGSNEMEVAYFDAELINGLDEESGDFRAAATLVHEAKHVASFYQRLRNFAHTGTADPFQPAWVEEGTAEIVAEAASRRAWAAMGGPPVDHAVTAEDLQAVGPTPETAQAFMSVERAARYLRRQPNAVTVVPVGGANDGIYGSGWQFHRFLADAFYGPGGEAAFFKEQNDSLTAAGVAGLEALTGMTLPELLEGEAMALMYNGTGTDTPLAQYSTYDFASATEAVAGGTLGQFPWPVTGSEPEPFSSATFAGPIGESGLRVHDFTSDGTLPGIEIKVEVPAPASLLVARLQ